MAIKRSRRERTPSSSSKEGAPQVTRIDRYPILIGKNVDLASFTFDAHSFHIEDLFVDFSYIMLHHMDLVLSGTRAKTLSYEMILTKVFKHFEVSFRDLVILLPKATDTINTLTLKRMEIFKEGGRWVVKFKGFDDESEPSTLPFEDGKEMDEDEDDPLPRPRSHKPSSSTFDFTFTKDHYNNFNGWIDSLTSTVEGLHHTIEGLRNTMGTLQVSVDGMTTLLQALQSRLDAVLSPHLLPKN
ncbi:Uncharacterized protein Adt_35482 [Abeliophyllum distichum]|uniref:Uncharacterized protein n=1 Tax=Abeliophyllum distichum TaxID=126358 RepID=A0ABD1QIV1_9LAMI